MKEFQSFYQQYIIYIIKIKIQRYLYLFNQESYQLPKIKELLKEIKNDQIDLYVLLTNSDNYKEGFTNFVNFDKIVDIIDNICCFP